MSNCIFRFVKQIGWLAILGALISSVGCGGGGGSATEATALTTPTVPVTPAPTPVASAVIKGTTFPPMVGLNYRTATQSGVTDENGTYRYKAGEQVTFWLADAELATVPAAEEVTPLSGDDLAASNMLRLFKGLDADGNMSNGLVFPALPSTGAVPVDFSVETEVANALANVDTLALLPSATDPQITGALATARSKAAAKPITYGTDFSSFRVDTASACPASPALPVSGRVTLQGQPNWTTGAMSGEITLTLSGGTVLTVPFASASGTSAQGYRFKLSRTPIVFNAPLFLANGRTIELRTYAPGLAEPCNVVIMAMRDQRLPNVLPVARPGVALVDRNQTTVSYTGPTGSYDLDGRIVLTEWSASDGSTGTGQTFRVTRGAFSEVTVTLTVTDDEGGKSSRTWTLGNATKSLERLLDMLSGGYYVNRDGQYSTYYKVDLSRTKVIEVECDDVAKACSEIITNLSDVNTKPFLDGLSPQLGGFVYTDTNGRSIGFSRADSLPVGYSVQSGSGASSTRRTSGKSGSGTALKLKAADSGASSGSGGVNISAAPSAGTADCGTADSAPTLEPRQAACYKNRVFTFGWGDTLAEACQGALNSDDLGFYKAKNKSRCSCEANASVNTVATPFKCFVFFDSGA